ncbi:MAG: hypothetical protein ACKODX_12020 [Gemmata sp.]
MSTDSTPTGTLHLGWDFFTTEPGQHATLHCRVCGEPLSLTPDVVGPTGWAHAMAIRAGRASAIRHDVFRCRFGGEPWHRQALALRREADDTASERLAMLLTNEADEVVRTRMATRSVMG